MVKYSHRPADRVLLFSSIHFMAHTPWPHHASRGVIMSNNSNRHVTGSPAEGWNRDRVQTLVLAILIILMTSVHGNGTSALILPGDELRLENPADDPALKPFEIDGKELPRNLFFVSPGGTLPDMEGITVHGNHEGVFLVSGSRADLRALSMCGCRVTPVMNIPKAPPPDVRNWIPVDEPDPRIESMVNEVCWDDVRVKIQWLQDFGTRHGTAPNHEYVATSIHSFFEDLGLPTEMQPFIYFGHNMWNIEATQTGSRYPDKYFIICGHFDSTSRNIMKNAPGADDNGTGVTAVMTAAEILSRHVFEYSIRYICFDAEELMLIGSRRYAYTATRLGTDIIGVLNFDMLGYWKPGVEKDLEIETDHSSQWLASAIINAADIYTGTPYELHVYDDAWWGDHWYFWQAGFAAVNHEEAWDWYDPDFNPYYHSTQDRLEHLDPGFTVGNIKVGVAALATLAVYVPPVEVTFDLRPGSCRNPFNRKSRGIVPAVVLGSDGLDVRDIDLESLRIEGCVSPVRFQFDDIASADTSLVHRCSETAQDGIEDLYIKLSAVDIEATLGITAMGNEVPLHLTGRLKDGTPIIGEDALVIVGSGSPMQTFSAGEPESFVLYQNVPNPFNPSTVISFDVPQGGGQVTLCIYDVSGRLVRTILDGTQEAGRRSAVWEGLNDSGVKVAAGVYFYRLTGPGFVSTRKMMLVK